MAAVRARRKHTGKSPCPSVRLESIGPPAPPIVTRCSTTQARANGLPFGPPCTTRPVTTTRCARRSPPAPLSRQPRARALGSELPEIFRIEVLQVGLELVGAEGRGAGFGPGLLGPDELKSRSEEHTSELQSPCNLVCRLLLEKKKKIDVKTEVLKLKSTRAHAM